MSKRKAGLSRGGIGLACSVEEPGGLLILEGEGGRGQCVGCGWREGDGLRSLALGVALMWGSGGG